MWAVEYAGDGDRKRYRLFTDMIAAQRFYLGTRGAKLWALWPDGWTSVAWGGGDSLGPSWQERRALQRMNREALVQ